MALSLMALAFNSGQHESLVEFYQALGAILSPKKVKVGSMSYQGQINGIEIVIYQSNKLESHGLPSLALRFEVEKIDDVMMRLKAIKKAEVVMGIEMMPDGKKAIVLDPDGRSVEIVELWKND